MVAYTKTWVGGKGKMRFKNILPKRLLEEFISKFGLSRIEPRFGPFPPKQFWSYKREKLKYNKHTSSLFPLIKFPPTYEIVYSRQQLSSFKL